MQRKRKMMRVNNSMRIPSLETENYTYVSAQTLQNVFPVPAMQRESEDLVTKKDDQELPQKISRQDKIS